jgi:hypothetical protein
MIKKCKDVNYALFTTYLFASYLRKTPYITDRSPFNTHLTFRS